MDSHKLLQRFKEPPIIDYMEMVQLKVPQWEKHVGLLHGFVGRQGGKSGGRYASLNVSYRVGDDAKVVSQNVCDMKLAVGIHDGAAFAGDASCTAITSSKSRIKNSKRQARRMA
jgi:hypothetical protein